MLMASYGDDGESRNKFISWKVFFSFCWRLARTEFSSVDSGDLFSRVIRKIHCNVDAKRLAGINESSFS